MVRLDFGEKMHILTRRIDKFIGAGVKVDGYGTPAPKAAIGGASGSGVGPVGLSQLASSHSIRNFVC